MPVQPLRQPAEQAGAARDALQFVSLGQIFGLDQRHVDGARTFLLATLARDAEIHRRRQVGMGERLRAQFAIQRRLERLDPRPGGMRRIVRDAKTRAHHPLAIALALVIVHADGNRLGVIAAGRRNAGIGVAHAISVVS